MTTRRKNKGLTIATTRDIKRKEAAKVKSGRPRQETKASITCDVECNMKRADDAKVGCGRSFKQK